VKTSDNIAVEGWFVGWSLTALATKKAIACPAEIKVC